MEEKIYNILFDKSTVDGVRLIHEDEWPIKELAALLAYQEKTIRHEMASEIIAKLPTRYDAPMTFQEMYFLTEALVSKYLSEQKKENKE